jgi:hypothetical protein
MSKDYYSCTLFSRAIETRKIIVTEQLLKYSIYLDLEDNNS